MAEAIHPNTMSKIRQLNAMGLSKKKIASMCDVSESAVYKYSQMSQAAYIAERQRYYKNAHSRTMNGKTNRIGSKDQLCWHCQKACGGCAWSRSLEPVEGWNAEETYIPEPRGNIKKMTRGYLIYDCPEFVKDECEV